MASPRGSTDELSSHVMADRATPPARRRRDVDGPNPERDVYRALAERAYQLFVEAGSDRTRTLEYWAAAEHEISESQPSK
jgi:hypothetical protein